MLEAAADLSRKSSEDHKQMSAPTHYPIKNSKGQMPQLYMIKIDKLGIDIEAKVGR
jgi:hypothetical protein